LLRRRGEVYGLNTNVWALTAALRAIRPAGAEPDRVLLLGGGGTARSALAALARQWPMAEVFLSARRPEAAEELRQRFEVTSVAPEQTGELEPAVVINSTTWGETAESEAAGPFAFPAETLLRPGRVLFDLNNRRSALQEQALAAGCVVMSGTLMQRLTHACRAAAVRCVLDGGDR
jgi:shikimate dehydrogenase